MDSLIKKRAVIQALANTSFEISASDWVEMVSAINNIPSIRMRRGHWIRDGHHIICNQCEMSMCDKDREGDTIPRDFCPSCGASMRE